MLKLRIRGATPIALASCIGFACAGISAAHAQATTNSASLPLLNVPYVSSIDAGCFTQESVCLAAGSLTLTSTVSSTFDVNGQDIVTDATYSAWLTDLFGTPIVAVTLTGTMEQEVLGRTSDPSTGLWDTDATDLSLSGTANGSSLAMTLDPNNASTGQTSITSNDDGSYLVSSFFDMFVDLSLNGSPPQEQGPIYFDATVPEPSSLMVLSVPLVALVLMRRRRRK